MSEERVNHPSHYGGERGMNPKDVANAHGIGELTGVLASIRERSFASALAELDAVLRGPS